ncbi:transposase [Streptomyces sp. A3M-1-3]|uniref:RNA-guided endonuclease InsQ/TnpB family protein n=1 Tax=Streptomyces sp. A3M-1-3 TaxID=2962044 RepID=UPI0027E4B603|nr:transposase [Streptomyces sp. A3M-1-3]
MPQRILTELGVGEIHQCQGAIALQIRAEESEVAVSVCFSFRPPAEREIRDQREEFQFCLVVEAHPGRARTGLIGSVEGVLCAANGAEGSGAVAEISLVDGRRKHVAFTAAPGQLATLALYRKGESDLVQRDGMWFLLATCDVSEAALNTDPSDFLGIDLGIVNIATTSDGQIMAGRDLNLIRVRERGLRTKLQKKNTPSAKRRLKKRRRKEARRAKDINHKIAKHVVAEAERTGRGIALEDLTGIRERVRLRKPQRATHSSWAFAQLGAFIAYKARRAGVPVVHVDPAYTSRTCAECGHIDRANRVSQARFACRNCGFFDHADRNGSRNIRARAWELWRRGAPSTAPAPPPKPGGPGWTQAARHRQ